MGGIGVRFLIAFLLICFTWNPTRFNFVAWAIAQWSNPDAGNLLPIIVFVGIVLVIGWIFYLHSMTRSLGVLGIILALALASSILWILWSFGVVNSQSRQLLSWVVIVLFAAVLTAGMSWSHLRRGWAGQADVDDVDER